jgi:photosystem II stability/assembly factor-like uncharacterized protein
MKINGNFNSQILIIFLLLISFTSFSQKEIEKKSSVSLSGLKFRSIGPALTSGRIVDFAVNSNNRSEYYVAVASGGVWKTENAGTTWNPIFDSQSSYSIGCITIDPNNENLIWVGTGENNSQRSVSYGDGVYKSEDGGKTWKNMGLKTSEHIAKIFVDPRNSNVIYVASQGPLWRAGGERGLFKSTDGGKTWNNILSISENTGITDIVFDPRNQDIIYAASYQRRRHVYTLINGGPEAAIYKSNDAGENWQKLANGLPSGDLGRIGLAISPANPDYVFALIEASGDKGGFFRSTDKGASWVEQYNYKSNSAQYYQEIICHPTKADIIYSLDTWTKFSKDGGKTWNNLGNKSRHVDDHALWIDPKNTDYILIGGDGGIYETFDHAKNWKYIANLPVTQFYRITVDNDYPFYNVYGGTQDNSTLGGPSQTTNTAGIVNSDWFITVGGDGYESQVDPTNPNVVYSQWQYGGLVRYDKETGERIGIKPKEAKDEAPYRWNWNSPLIISPHSHTRLYFAANKLFRSNDMGNSWETISPDLTRQLDRNSLPVMDKIQSVDAVAKNASTSLFGNIVSLAESPLQENLIYIGTDDGLIQITEDAGKNWKKFDKFKGIPELTYVSCIYTSNFDVNTVFASFDNRKRADFKPYILKSTDKGKTWISISSNLPENGTVHTIAQDHVKPELIFVGTEFGVYFTNNGGEKWTQLESGLPTISVRDIDIQKRENDLVLGTFGRGIYILDDYSPLRLIDGEFKEKESFIFPINEALLFSQTRPLNLRNKGVQGESYYTAKNPQYGASFYYYLKNDIKTVKQKRQKAEKDALEKNTDIAYPDYLELKAEDTEVKPYLIFTIFDRNDKIIRKLRSSANAGIHRITWDLRHPSTSPARFITPKPGRYSFGDAGKLIIPGNYKISLSKCVNDSVSELFPPTPFKVVPLLSSADIDRNRQLLSYFLDDIAEINRSMKAANKLASDLNHKAKLIRIALNNSGNTSQKLEADAKKLLNESQKIIEILNGDPTLSKRNDNQAPTILNRISTITYELSLTSSAPTKTHTNSFKIAK